MLAFHNSPAIKQQLLFRVGQHPELFVRFMEEGLRDYRKKDLRLSTVVLSLQRTHGLPEDVTLLMHAILQKLPRVHINIFRDQFLAAIRPGADLSLVTARFIYWLNVDPDGPRRNLAEDDLYYLDFNAELYAQHLRGETVDWQPAIKGADFARWLAGEDFGVPTTQYDFAWYALMCTKSVWFLRETVEHAARLTSPQYWVVMNYKLTELLSSA